MSGLMVLLTLTQNLNTVNRATLAMINTALFFYKFGMMEVMVTYNAMTNTVFFVRQVTSLSMDEVDGE